MKNLLLTILLACVAFPSLSAKKVKGLIIFENDSLEVVFSMPHGLLGEPSYIKIQNGIKYLVQGKRKRLTPEEAKEIQFEHYGELIRMVSVNQSSASASIFSADSNRSFMKLEIDGQLKLFTSYYRQQSPSFAGPNGVPTGGGSTVQSQSVLQKSDGEFFTVPSLGFRKKTLPYFEDCPCLAQKIESKQYRKKDIRLIVEYYNKMCE